MSCRAFLTFSLTFFGIAGASPQRTLYASAPVDRGAYFAQGKNVYNYGYNTGDGTAKVEAKHADGSVTGSYRYFDPLGRQIVRSYVADERGFRVLGNDLPISPETPAVGVLKDETLYATAEGTGELTKTRDYTSSFLLNNQLGAAKWSPSFIRSHYNHVPRHHRNILREQDSLIRQYETQLKQLKSQRKNLQRLHWQPQQFQSGDVKQSTLLNTHGNYFYHDKKRDYDFPAGFAYVNPRTTTRNVKDLLIIDDSHSSKVVYRPLLRRRSDRNKW